MEQSITGRHLTEDELLRLALPGLAEPEAVPPHVLQCGECGRGLEKWKAALRELAAEDEAALARRTADEWRSREVATLAAIRRSGAPGARRRRVAWGLGLAASLLLAALVATVRPWEDGAPDLAEVAALSGQDRADDALLRDVAVLARGEDAGGLWNSLAPVPGEPPVPEEENL